MKKTTLILGFSTCFLLWALLRFPEAMLAASAESVQLWLTKVFPSLFPFIAACSLLLHIGAAERMGAILRPLMQPLFRLPGIAAFPFFLGILSGYPMGAKITAMLYEKKLLTLEEAQHILVFSNNPGPLFLIGTIGVGFFHMPILGYLLLFSSFFGAVVTGILWRFRRKNAFFSPRTSPASVSEFSVTEALSASVSDAVNTILLIGGYLILFGAISEAMEQANLFSLLSCLLFFLPLAPETLRGFCSGILEMTNGAYLLSLSPDGLRLRLALVAFLVSFGGLSILGQTFGVLARLPISKKSYIKGKALNGLFSCLFFYFLYPFFEQNAQKAVPVFSFFTETALTLSFLWLLPSLLFLGTLCCALILKRKR
ncbi:nucleoside recognition domain-containing protein [Anaerotignum sp.]